MSSCRILKQSMYQPAKMWQNEIGSSSSGNIKSTLIVPGQQPTWIKVYGKHKPTLFYAPLRLFSFHAFLRLFMLSRSLITPQCKWKKRINVFAFYLSFFIYMNGYEEKRTWMEGCLSGSLLSFLCWGSSQMKLLMMIIVIKFSNRTLHHMNVDLVLCDKRISMGFWASQFNIFPQYLIFNFYHIIWE